MNEKEIKKQAKEIIDSFMKALGKVKEPELRLVERDEFERQEKEGDETDSDFREIMFENFRIKDFDSARKSKKAKDFRHAPNKNGDSIIAEKKKW